MKEKAMSVHSANESAATRAASDFPQHSLLKSLGLHVVPGVLTTAAFLLLKPLLDPIGYPPLLACLLAVALIDLPVLLGVMLYEGKRLNGRFGLGGVVLYREKVSWVTFALAFVGTFVVVYALTMGTTPLSNLLAESGFSWLPDWMFLDERTQYQAYSKDALLVTFGLHLVLTGVALPWVEELYFRGYLLPRLSRFGKWAPLLGGLFFGLYHVWQLLSFPTVFLLGMALGYVVWWKRDIRISISLHVFANGLMRLMFLMAALAT
jgi:membrane protease YdiL (CAAX protease family)